MTDQSHLQFSDALIEKMLAQRAAPGAPADLILSIAAAIESTGQRAPGVRGAVSGRGASRTHRDPGTLASRRILQVGAFGIAVVVVAAGAGLFLRLSPALIGGRPVRRRSRPWPHPRSRRRRPRSRPHGPPPWSPTRSTCFGPAPWRRPAGCGSSARTEPVPTSCSRVARADQSSVAWSPDGTRLVYADAGRLYLTDARGTARMSLTPVVQLPAPTVGRVFDRRHPARLCARCFRGHRNGGPRERSSRGAGHDGRHRQRATPLVARRNADRLLPPGQVRRRLRCLRRRRGRPEPPSAQPCNPPRPFRRLVARWRTDRLYVPRLEDRPRAGTDTPTALARRLHGPPRRDRLAPVDDRRELDRSDVDAGRTDPVQHRVQRGLRRVGWSVDDGVGWQQRRAPRARGERPGRPPSGASTPPGSQPRDSTNGDLPRQPPANSHSTTSRGAQVRHARDEALTMNENVSAKRLLSGLAATLLVASCATSAAGTPSPLAATSAATPGPTAVRTPAPATAAPSPSPRGAGQMTVGRGYHAAALLADGRVLVLGGYAAGSQALASADLFDPKTGIFSPTGPMATARSRGPAATRLADGRILVTGGFDRHRPRSLRRSSSTLRPAPSPRRVQ